MIKLVKTDQRINLSGVTPAFVAGATLFFAALIVAYFYSQKSDSAIEVCLFKRVTHQPCFLCGGTRASMALLRGGLLTAWKFNPLVTVFILFLFFSVILKVLFRRAVVVKGILKNRVVAWGTVILLVVINWVYVLRYLEV